MNKRKAKANQDVYLVEKICAVAAFFLFAAGLGLIADGNKIMARQIKVSQHIDFHATLNPYQ